MTGLRSQTLSPCFHWLRGQRAASLPSRFYPNAVIFPLNYRTTGLGFEGEKAPRMPRAFGGTKSFSSDCKA